MVDDRVVIKESSKQMAGYQNSFLRFAGELPACLSKLLNAIFKGRGETISIISLN